jgi:dihydrofolate synthase/folylpolyglutamate synthase
MMAAIAAQAERAGADFLPRGDGWNAATYQDKLHYRDALSTLSLPLPALAGSWQAENAALAIAMLRHQSSIVLPESAYRAGLGWAKWPARFQPLHAGPLTTLLPEGSAVWLDGCHNPAGAETVAPHVLELKGDDPWHIVTGILANKDAEGILEPFIPLGAHIHAVPVPGHEHHAPEELVAWAHAQGLQATAAGSVAEAFGQIGKRSRVLVLCSLYLAGTVLKANGEEPD